MPLAYGLIQPVDVKLPNLPHELDGMRVLHISDLHIQRRSRLFARLLNQLTSIRHDLTVFTGDYMSRPGDEDVSLKVLREICGRLNPGYGMYGVFGNHDYDEFRRRAGEVPIRWLNDEGILIADQRIEILGFNCEEYVRPDGVKVAMDTELECGPRGDSRLRLGLTHYPDQMMLPTDMGVDVLLAGHTHGGQIRLPSRRAMFNSSRLPLEYSAGLMRHQNMMMGVSRGIGYADSVFFMKWRFCCPPHMPLYTLRRGPMLGKYADGLEMIQKW